MNQNFERNFISNQNGTDKTNPISENLFEIKVTFESYQVADVPRPK